MSNPPQVQPEQPGTWWQFLRGRTAIAWWILTISAGIIIATAVMILIRDDESLDRSFDVFTILVPVVAAWVGTVLAFYFGRENFESASEQVREMARTTIAPVARAQRPIMEIMRPIEETVKLELAAGETLANKQVSDLEALFTGEVKRLPVLDANGHAQLFIHKSKVDEYVATDGNESTDTLDVFVQREGDKSPPDRYGKGFGFEVVSPTTTIGDARKTLADSSGGAQDLLITVAGRDDRAVIGWVSNTRLVKRMEGGE